MKHIQQARGNERTEASISRNDGAPDIGAGKRGAAFGDISRPFVAEDNALNTAPPAGFHARPRAAIKPPAQPQAKAKGEAGERAPSWGPPRAGFGRPVHSGTTHAGNVGDVHSGATHAKAPEAVNVLRGAEGHKAPSQVSQKMLEAASRKAPKAPRSDRFGVTAMTKASRTPTSGFRGPR